MDDDAGKKVGLTPALLSAARLIEWRRLQSGRAAIAAPAAVILTHQAGLFRAMTPRFGSRVLRGLLPEILLLDKDGKVGLAGNFGIGAPVTAMAVEELVAAGVQRLIAVDVAGSLTPELKAGDVVLVEAAICDEGTSPHYAATEALALPDEALMTHLGEALEKAGIGHRRARVWSTDAPFRETEAAVARYRDQGARLVDMETSAFLMVAAALGVTAAAVLVVGDSLHDGWQPPADPGRLQAELRRVVAAARGCLLA